MIGRILVGLDGSKSSKVAGEYGIYLSKNLKRPVIGVHIIDIRLLEGPFLADISGGLGFSTYADILPKVKEVLEAKAEAILDEFAVECREKGGDCSIAEAYGIVVNELVNMADPEDIIIVGKKGQHQGFMPLLLGSTAEAVARKSNCPVMITADNFKEIKNILFAFDGREKSVHGAAYVNYLSKHLNVNSVKVISVFEDKVKDSEKKQEFESRLKNLLEVNFEFVDKYGEPEEMIEEFINSNKDSLDLVIMGAYGESPVRELILGSTTNYITSKSPIPVLLVK
ncbi:universal stress protein [Sulfurihydrogenibium azorense]|uniref:universal stress protein n=1 Tax=Sulfurihydrogenibium azorense TaxID=309806 RepID=UPI002409C3B3|nr:universal stress protein [Sulfurihydrogenibium azorense]MDM7273421.1 universal stress protein [Sulfurihydrogenibium azorense]